MPGCVRISVTSGPIKGREFVFREHDILLLGRLAEVIDRALAVDTQARYQTSGEMRQALAKVL